jgi:hypothetical protein
MRNKILKQKEISVESKMARAEWRMSSKKAHVEVQHRRNVTLYANENRAIHDRRTTKTYLANIAMTLLSNIQYHRQAAFIIQQTTTPGIRYPGRRCCDLFG